MSESRMGPDHTLMNIILMGYRGCGKTTIGRIVAEKLQRPFFDTDAMIQER